MASRTERLAPLSGVASIALLAVSTILIDFYEYLPDPADIQAHLTDNDTRVLIGGYVGLLAAALLFWFASSLRSTLRAAEGGDGRVSNIAFGAMVGAAVLFVATFAVTIAAGARAGSTGGISADAATTTYDLSATLTGSGVALALGVAIGAFAVVAFRTRVMPRWVAWASAVIAVGSISPVSYIFVGFAAAWVVYVSVVLYTTGRRTVSADGL